MTMKFCADCRFCKPKHLGWIDRLFFSDGADLKFSKCMHPMACKERDREYEMIDPNFVVPPAEQSYCAVMRQFGCGPEAKFWETK